MICSRVPIQLASLKSHSQLPWSRKCIVIICQVSTLNLFQTNKEQSISSEKLCNFVTVELSKNSHFIIESFLAMALSTRVKV